MTADFDRGVSRVAQTAETIPSLTDPSGDWMDSEELRRLLPNVGRTTFYRLARENKLPIPTVRVGRKFVFSRRAYADLVGRQHDAE